MAVNSDDIAKLIASVIIVGSVVVCLGLIHSFEEEACESDCAPYDHNLEWYDGYSTCRCIDPEDGSYFAPGYRK